MRKTEKDYIPVFKKLNLGCGDDIKKEYINQDIFQFGKIDDVFNFNNYPWKYKDNSFEEIRIKNCIICAEDMPKFMKEIWRISKPDAKIKVLTQFFLSTESANYPYVKCNINYNSFDIFLKEKEFSKKLNIEFEIKKRKWIYSENKYLKIFNFLPNVFPKFYGRFLYFILPSNKLYFELKTVK